MPDDQLSIPDAVRWAVNNFEAVVSDSIHGGYAYAWDKAATDPPNALGKHFMIYAATNATGFVSKIIPQFLGREEDKSGVSDEDLAKDKKLLREIDKVLEQFAEEK